MKDLTPAAWISGLTITDGSVNIPIVSMDGVIPESLNDIRGVIVGVLHALKSHQDQLPSKDRVGELRITSSSSGGTTTFQVRVMAVPAAFSFPNPTSEPAIMTEQPVNPDAPTDG